MHLLRERLARGETSKEDAHSVVEQDVHCCVRCTKASRDLLITYSP